MSSSALPADAAATTPTKRVAVAAEPGRLAPAKRRSSFRPIPLVAQPKAGDLQNVFAALLRISSAK
ncbi:hypothetical protein E4U41_004614, partial [Claviceps citrina]